MKLTTSQVRSIFLEYFTTNCNISLLSKKYAVHSSTIGNIVNRKGWAKITNDLLYLKESRKSIDVAPDSIIKDEIWKDYVGFEGLYKISNFGRIKRLARQAKGRNNKYRTIKEKIAKFHDNGRGYLYFILSHHGKHHRQYIHRAVAKHFIDNPKNFSEVNHKDGNKSNNFASNLVWCCPSENQKHAYDIGLKYKLLGELNGMYKGE